MKKNKLTILAVCTLALTLITGCVTGPDGKKHVQLFTTTTNETGQVEYQISPAVASTLGSIQTANAAFNATPSAPLVNMGLGGVSSVLALIAAFKTRKANRLETSIQSVIKGVEQGTKDGTIKKAIQSAALAAGVAEEVHKQVRTATGKA